MEWDSGPRRRGLDLGTEPNGEPGGTGSWDAGVISGSDDEGAHLWSRAQGQWHGCSGSFSSEER